MYCVFCTPSERGWVEWVGQSEWDQKERVCVLQSDNPCTPHSSAPGVLLTPWPLPDVYTNRWHVAHCRRLLFLFGRLFGAFSGYKDMKW